MKRFAKTIGAIFLLILLIYVGVYFAIKWGLTNEQGRVDENSAAYAQISAQTASTSPADTSFSVDQPDDGSVLGASTESATEKTIAEKTLCQIYAISLASKRNALAIKQFYRPNENQAAIDKMIFAVKIRLKDNTSLQENLNRCSSDNLFIEAALGELDNIDWSNVADSNIFEWINTEEWGVIIEALAKDKDQMIKAANESDLPPRMLLSTCIVEQLRLYFTQREYYEKAFKPYKILGNANVMAWGVMSIKEDTAVQIENNLKDSNSPYYLGAKYEHLLDFTTGDQKQERFLRLTDARNHYYSYLYGALYIKEIEVQWQKAGFDVSSRPEIIATLFNLGFNHSQPKADPAVGGSEIEINGIKYTFGSLAFEFYYSGEMADNFPL